MSLMGIGIFNLTKIELVLLSRITGLSQIIIGNK